MSTESRIDIIVKLAYKSQFVNQQSLRPITELVERPLPPVFECDDAVEAAGEIEVVGGDQCGEARVADEIEEGVQDTLAGRVVEVAGRLVAEQDPGIVGERPGDRDALLLAAGEPRRPVPGAAA
jgi:hypothetical protein